jgi:NTP pyrophosphatase (non-canonical NTP hydrolase)
VNDHNDQRFITDVALEVSLARRKFPNQNITTTFIALAEELGEVAKEILEGTSKRTWEEAVQVAAMAMRLATEHANDHG